LSIISQQPAGNSALKEIKRIESARHDKTRRGNARVAGNPGRPFGPSTLRASGTKRSTGKFSRITPNFVAVIRLKFAPHLGHSCGFLLPLMN